MEYMYTVYPNVRHSHITLVGQDQSHQFAISMNIPRNKPHVTSHMISDMISHSFVGFIIYTPMQ